jgi:hypothetical protein
VLLSIQAKPDCPVSKTRLSGFHIFNFPGQNLPLHLFSHFTLILSRTTMRTPPRPTLVISWFLRGIFEFMSEFHSPRTGVSDSPTGFPLLKVFSPHPQSLCCMNGFEIPLVYCLHSCLGLLPCNISWNQWMS